MWVMFEEYITSVPGSHTRGHDLRESRGAGSEGGPRHGGHGRGRENIDIDGMSAEVRRTLLRCARSKT